MTSFVRTRLTTVVAFLVLVAPAMSDAQPTGKVYRIGVLDNRSMALNTANIEAFRQGMRELGYKEGQNLELTYRSSDGDDSRFPGLASELVRLNVDLILTRGTPAAVAAKNATRAIPVVMAASGDPVGTGLVKSLAHPGGNLTGLSMFNVEIYAKRVELLKELLPQLTRVAGLFNMGNPVNPIQWKQVEATARSLGVQTQLLDVRRSEDLARTFDVAAKARAEALVVGVDGVTMANLQFDRRARQQAAAPIDLSVQGVCAPRWVDELWSERAALVSTSRNLYGQDLQGREASRSCRRAADHVRAGDQSQNG